MYLMANTYMLARIDEIEPFKILFATAKNIGLGMGKRVCIQGETLLSD
jgi:hypothetical protein